MNPNALFAEQFQVVSGFVPVDMSAAANNGDWVNMENYGRCTILLFKAAGTAGQDPVITVNQATTNAGGSSKALNFSVIHEKVGTLTSVGQYTMVDQSAANTYENLASAESQGIFLIDIQAEDLDSDNDFKFIQASVPDVGAAAQLGCLLYLLSFPRYGGVLPSALA